MSAVHSIPIPGILVDNFRGCELWRRMKNKCVNLWSGDATCIQVVKLLVKCCRVECGAETQVSATAWDGCQWCQCSECYGLSVRKRSHWQWRHANARRFATTTPQSAGFTSQFRTPEGFRSPVSCHQEGTTSSVVGRQNRQIHRPISDQSGATDVHQREKRLWSVFKTSVPYKPVNI